MPRVIGLDPGTVSIDICGLSDGSLFLDLSLPTVTALAEPASLLQLLTSSGPPDLIAGPSGYGLPMVPAAEASEQDLQLAVLAAKGEAGGIGGLLRLLRLLRDSGLPVVFTPGVIHLPTVPAHRKLNRIDIGTADKVAAAVLAVHDQSSRYHCAPGDTSFILLELGGGFTALVGVEGGRIVDGIGGTSGPIGWLSSGAWDGEVAYLAGEVTKELLFTGGAGASPGGTPNLPAYLEGAEKAVLAMTSVVRQPREILLSGRRVGYPGLFESLRARLEQVAPIRRLSGFAKVAKEGAQGAAIIADGLAGGSHRDLIATLELRGATGTVLDHLRIIGPERARRRLGLA